MTHFQKPNKSIIIALVFGIISIVTNETIHIVSVIIAATAGTIWSYQEALEGVNSFRRKLGLVGYGIVAIYFALSLLIFISTSKMHAT